MSHCVLVVAIVVARCGRLSAHNISQISLKETVDLIEVFNGLIGWPQPIFIDYADFIMDNHLLISKLIFASIDL